MSSDSESGDKTLNESFVDTQPRTSERLKEKERSATILRLSTELCSFLAEKSKLYDSSFYDNVICEGDINSLIAKRDALEHDIKSVNEQYQKVIDLCENNKANESVEAMRNHFIDETKTILQLIAKELSDLDRLDAEMEEKKKEFEQQVKQYEEQRKRREEARKAKLEEQPTESQVTVKSVSIEPTSQEKKSDSEIDDTSSTSSKSIQQEDNSSDGLLKRLVECMGKPRKAKRSAIEPTVFDGTNLLEFNDWEIDFDAYVEEEELEGSEPLRHMKRFLAGEARRCVNGYFAINTKEAYAQARSHLHKRYGDRMNIAKEFRKQLTNWPRIGPKDGKAIERYSDFLEHCKSAMYSNPELAVLDDTEQNEKMALKLPDWMRNKWARKVAKYKKEHGSYPKFEKFSHFVRNEAEVMTEPLLQQSTITPPQHKQEHRFNKEKTARVMVTREANGNRCLHCLMDNHKTADCFKLEKLDIAKKREFVKAHRLCYGCLLSGHQSKNCKSRATCKRCQKNHPTAMHQNIPSKQPSTASKESTNNASASHQEPTSTTLDVSANTTKRSTATLSMVVPVYVSAEGGSNPVLVYALLDTQADVSFITKETAEKVKAPGIKESITISTLNGTSTESQVNYFKNLRIAAYDSDNFCIAGAYETESIPCSRHNIPTRMAAERMKHVQHIADKFPEHLDIPIGLLIGVNCPEALAPRESVIGENGDAFAVRTLLGWTLCGGKESNSDTKVHTIQLHSCSIEDQEFREPIDKDASYSQDDIKFLKTMEESIKQREDGYLEMALPFRSRPSLPNNKKQALDRLLPLKKRFGKDPNYRTQYTKMIDELIAAKHAEEIPEKDQVVTGEVWYIPHFSVKHPKKESIRVVFDCSSRYQDTAINDHLLQGPDHMNSLLGILLRFRQYKIAFTCDIQKMFYNFYVSKEDRDFLRFLWFDENLEVKEYRMCVHIFGATSSPAVATYGLRAIARRYAIQSPEASKLIMENFYVDDGLYSTDSQNMAKEIISSATKLCSESNIRLHKFLCNDKSVLETIPESERSVSNNGLLEKLPTQRTLGLDWDSNEDLFRFTTNLNVKDRTKRGILSTISQIFDPLGLLAPFTLKGKHLLQELCKRKVSWDDPLDQSFVDQWENWLRDAQTKLTEVTVRRCLREGVDNVIRSELHHFADASTVGYGSCSYLKSVTQDGKVHCALIMAKSRVAPIKATTIPRLELQGAVTASRLARVIRKELDITIDAEYFWIDSKIVLGYIHNESRKFKAYVANRVAEILEDTKPEQWHYVNTEANPADIASRGSYLGNLLGSMWFNGPSFLSKQSIATELERGAIMSEMIPDDIEVSKNILVTITKGNDDPKKPFISPEKFKRYSSWKSLLRSLARLRDITAKKTWKADGKDLKVIAWTKQFILKIIQEESFAQDLEKLREKGCVDKKSSIHKLDPFLDEDGLIRVGGRLRNSTALHESQKHPLIIPKTSHVARLIIMDVHDSMHHTGVRTTMAALRDAGYWVINAKSIIKSIINNCVTCRRTRQPPVQQKMGDLPKERVEQSPPFTHIGIDAFGPFTVKDRRTMIKRWGLLITCLYSRAVHVELLDDLSSDAFINALRCFIAIRGKVATIFCDQGTNFVGAYNELKAQVDMVSDEAVKHFMLKNMIEFRFNPPDASHRGGVWERLIKSIRSVLNGMKVKYEGRMDSSTLRTAFHEAANTVNSRPLTASDVDNPLETIVTPNHLLTMKTSETPPPPGIYEGDEIYGRKRWRKAQQFAEEFWLAWRAEFMGYLTHRSKWLDSHENIKVGDVVLLKDEATSRNLWKIGKVEFAIKGSDGLVREVVIKLGDKDLNSKGKRLKPTSYLTRAIQKVIVLVKSQ